MKMRAGVVPQHGALELWDISEPAPGPYECLVKIEAAAICTGTDSNIIAGTFPWLTATPFVLGHESAGTIVNVGPKVRNLKKGMRVTRPAAIFPGERRDGIGSNWAAFAEWGMVRDRAAAEADGVHIGGAQPHTVLPDDVDPISAALSVNHREILSVSANLGINPESRVAIIGSGYNGLLFSLFSKLRGAARVVIAGNANRKDIACGTFEADALVDYRAPDAAAAVERALGGATTHVIDAVGAVASLALARQLARSGAAFGRYGLHEFKAIGPLTEEIKKTNPELPMHTDEVGAADEWYKLWKKGFFDREGIHDGTMPLEDIVAAFDRLRRREAVKLILTM
jgi:threonine dehydrogenase-like Zn-dependent dehydrogenase